MNTFNRLGLFFTLLVGFGACSPIFAMARGRQPAKKAPVALTAEQQAQREAAAQAARQDAEAKAAEAEARRELALENARAKIEQEAADKKAAEDKAKADKAHEEKVEKMVPPLRAAYRLTKSLSDWTNSFNAKKELEDQGKDLKENIEGAGETLKTFGTVMKVSGAALATALGLNKYGPKMVEFNAEHKNIPAIGGAVLASLAVLMFMDEIKSGVMSMMSSSTDKDAPVKYADLNDTQKAQVDAQAAQQAAQAGARKGQRGNNRRGRLQVVAPNKDTIANFLFKRDGSGWFSSIVAK
ncbi:MAG: hypothetical protein NT124_03750 [Candidatus Dependentiae bacterium]|nr:hypothetical protein [Candidatus Dependentiae bacterium]